jgi:putative colanic acid polymerase
LSRGLSALPFTLCVVTSHFVLFDFYGFPVTPAIAVILLVAFFHFRWMPSPPVLLGWLLLCTYPALVAFTRLDSLDWIEFFRTYALWVFAVTAIVVAATGRIRRRAPVAFGNWAVQALATVTVFSAVQVLSASRGSALLYRPFGENTYFGGYDVYNRSSDIRASGFYLEPSFNAFVANLLLSVVLLHGSKAERRVGILLAVISLVLTRSLAGAVGLIVVLLLRLGYGHGRAGLVWLAGTLLVVPIVLMSGPLDWLVARISTVTVEGSSANYRLLAPLQVLQDVFLNSPIGVPLGSIEATFASYDLLNGADRGTSLDNGVYLVIFYTGFFGVCFLIACTVQAVVLVLYRRRRSGVAVVVGLVMLGYSGGILLPEFVLGFGLFIYAWRTRPEGAVDANSGAPVEPSYRYVERSRGASGHRGKPAIVTA